MDRYTEVYETIRNACGAWIFDDEGNLKDNICCVNTLDIIDSLNWISDENEIAYLDSIVDDCEYLAWENTYNWNANVTHDIDVRFIEHNDEVIACAKFHISGDVRANYTDYLYFNCGGAGWANKSNATMEFWYALDDIECAAGKEFTYDGYTFCFEPKATTEDIFVYEYVTGANFEIYNFEITEDVLKDCAKRAKEYSETKI